MGCRLAGICVWIFKFMLNVCFSRQHSFLHFRTETFIRLLCTLRFDNVLSSGQEDAGFPGTLLFRTRCFSVGIFSSRRSFFCFFVVVFLSGLLFVAFQLTFFGLPITSPSPFRDGSWYERLGCFCIPGGVLCLPIDFQLFPALVPGLLQRLCIVLRRGVLRPPVVRRTNTRPSPAALFCAAPRLPLYSRPHYFVSRDIFLSVSLLSRASFRLIFALTFFLSHLLAGLCCRPSQNNRMRMKPDVCLLSC